MASRRRELHHGCVRRRRSRARGFELEEYYEARFLISAERKPEEVLARLSAEFGLDTVMELDFHDRYFQIDVPGYSGRTPRARLRDRGNEEMAAKGRPWGARSRSIQVIFTRAAERSPEQLEQYRYFPIRKDKLYRSLEGSAMPTCLRELPDGSVRDLMSRIHREDSYTEIRFRRRLAHNKDLLASVDHVGGDRPSWMLELKTHRRIRLLIEAMRFVMTEFPVIQTTHGKQELVHGGEDAYR
jgi:hypothetical protein